MGIEEEINNILNSTESESEEKLAATRATMVSTAHFIERQVKFLEDEGVNRELAYTLVLLWYSQGQLPPDL